jgi:hypothetical protein
MERKNKKIGILCALCAINFCTIEATPWAELKAFLAERGFFWQEELKNYVRDIQKSANYLSKMEKINPWDGIKEVLKKYPFLETVFGTPPRISLQNGIFFGTEQEWQERHRRQLRQHLSYLKYFSERLSRETNALICIVQNITDVKNLPNTEHSERNILLDMAWKDVRATVYGSPHKLTFPEEGKFRAQRQRKKHEELRWQQEGQHETDSQKFKSPEDDMTEADLHQLLSQNGFPDEESVSRLEADVEDIMQKYGDKVSSPTPIPIFPE